MVHRSLIKALSLRMLEGVRVVVLATLFSFVGWDI